MTTLTIDIPEPFHAELSEIAKQLKQTPEQCAVLALSFFLQTDTSENAIEGFSRIGDNQTLVDFEELKEEIGIEVQFHPNAMDELESLEEEEQIELLDEFITRISAQSEEENSIDLVLKEEGDEQIVLSSFEFGDIIYKLGTNIIIYHIALSLEEDDEEDDEEDEEEDLEAMFEGEGHHTESPSRSN